jgi:hypothetical protein
MTSEIETKEMESVGVNVTVRSILGEALDLLQTPQEVHAEASKALADGAWGTGPRLVEAGLDGLAIDDNERAALEALASGVDVCKVSLFEAWDNNFEVVDDEEAILSAVVAARERRQGCRVTWSDFKGIIVDLEEMRLALGGAHAVSVCCGTLSDGLAAKPEGLRIHREV